VDSGDFGRGVPDHDGDSPFQGLQVAGILCMNGCSLGMDNCARESMAGAAPVLSTVASPSLDPSAAAMGLRGLALAVPGPLPSPEGNVGEAGNTLAPGNVEAANGVSEVAPVEPQDAPRSAPNDEAPLTAPAAGRPLAGLLPLDLDTVRRAADAFFARLTDLAREPLAGHPAGRVVPWLGVLTVVAYEWARTRQRPTCALRGAGFPEGEV
jgi:hypothetical protein